MCDIEWPDMRKIGFLVYVYGYGGMIYYLDTKHAKTGVFRK